jgi:hypothetical protein
VSHDRVAVGLASTWATAQRPARVGLRVLGSLILALAWPRRTAPDHVVIEVVNGPTVLSTQVVPLNRS